MPVVAPEQLEAVLSEVDELPRLPAPPADWKGRARSAVRRGRPPVAPNVARVQFLADADEIAAFDEEMKKLGITRAEGLRRLLTSILD